MKGYILKNKEKLLGSFTPFKNFDMVNSQVFLYVKHQALIYLTKKLKLTGMLAQWMLLLYDFNYTIIHIIGKELVFVIKKKHFQISKSDFK